MLEALQTTLAEQGTVRFSVRVQPSAPITRLVKTLPDGSLKVALAAAATDGKANAALVRFLADSFGVPKNAVDIVTGHMARIKVIEITRQ